MTNRKHTHMHKDKYTTYFPPSYIYLTEKLKHNRQFSKYHKYNEHKMVTEIIARIPRI